MSWWATEANFKDWESKLEKYPVYEQQAEELRQDVRELFPGGIPIEPDPRILDVGGGNGRLKIGEVIDIHTGFDITKDWERQGMTTKKYEVAITSLTLIVLPEEAVDFILTQMRWYASRYIYLYEQVMLPGTHCGQMVDDTHGPKYSHGWEDHIERNKLKVVYKRSSKVKSLWERILIQI